MKHTIKISDRFKVSENGLEEYGRNVYEKPFPSRGFLNVVLMTVIMLILMCVAAEGQSRLSFSFTLPSAATVSAGVYKGDVLIRTVFSNKKYNAGTYVENYNALTDELQPITSTAVLTVKVLSNNVKYEWEGVVGNTSIDKSGPNIHKGFEQIYSLIIVGSKMYYSKHYSEGQPSQNITLLSNIQSKTRLFAKEPGGVGQGTEKIASDGKNVYWAGNDPFSYKYGKWHPQFVFATKVLGDTEVIFQKGIPYRAALGRTYKSVINFQDDSLARVTGLAVQKAGRFLFVAHGYKLDVVDKTTGDSITTIPIACGSLAVDMTDHLWICEGTNVNKYAVNSNGGIQRMLSLEGFSDPSALAVSPDNITVVIADAGESQQLKSFSNATGISTGVFGQEGGYFKSAAVSNDKFYFSDRRQKYGVSIAYQSNGSFWVIDGGNCRVQHYSPQRILMERIMYIPHHYNIYASQSDPESVYVDYLQFKIDYTKPLYNGWKLVNNWGANELDSNDDQYSRLRPVKFKNGRVYSPQRTLSDRKFEIIELTPEGLVRRTGIKIPASLVQLGPDGGVYTSPVKRVGEEMLWKRQPLAGFDTLNNPVWAAYDTIARIPVTKETDPAYTGPFNTLRAGEITESGLLIAFNGGKDSGFHLGAIKLYDSAYKWRTAPSTNTSYTGLFPSDGAYDLGNNVEYAGGVGIAVDKSIFWGYHGEFWKNSQTNKWNHVYDNGLMVGQFGVTGPETKGLEAAPMMAGNVMAASVVKIDDTIYLYHNDEGHHSGVHRWKLSGINTIKVATYPVSFNTTPSTDIPLTYNIPYDTVFTNNTSGWVRTPANDITTDFQRNWWTVRTNAKSYSRLDQPDIYAKFRMNTTTNASLTKSLGVNNLASWSISGKISYDDNMPNDATGAGGQWLEVLDANSKVIFRMYPQNGTGGLINLVANKTIIGTSTDFAFDNTNDFKISCVNGVLYIKFGDFAQKTILVYDAKANKKTPKTLRWYAFTKTANLARAISLKELKFTK